MTKTIALAAATALCTKLGPGWSPKVWENLGWHYKAQLLDDQLGEIAEVRESKRADDSMWYRAEVTPGLALGSKGPGNRKGLGCTLQYFGESTDPVHAVSEAWALMEKDNSLIMSAMKLAAVRLSTWEARRG